MAKAMNVLVAVIALAAIFFHSTEAEYEHELVWAIPSGGAAEYATWAAAHPFVLNGGADYDSLNYMYCRIHDDDNNNLVAFFIVRAAFDFATGEQDLAEVTKEDFDSCTTTNPIEKFSEAVNLAPAVPGTYYYTCTFAGHCTKGQKIAVTWTNTTAAAAPAPCPMSSATTYSALPLKFLSKNVNKGNN
uniref:blue copper protein-like n=1 Tax=Fragaria vesca subsp. vesca TaxID=101020 RepID=UPI0005CA1656|nr:PREDICTED: blue copper protein-like [Fragaria vesca subsp. vesca]